jgi:transglutaminase-like putative cysteine protease
MANLPKGKDAKPQGLLKKWQPGYRKGSFLMRRNVKVIVISLLVVLLSFNSICVFAQSVETNPRVTVSEGVRLDDSGSGQGLIRVAYNSPNDKRIKLMILRGEDRYIYNLDADGYYESFPLQMGNGEYKIYVLENLEGTKYRYISAESIDVQISNPNDVFLNSIQNIDWDYKMNAIKMADKLFAGLYTNEQKIKAAYDFIVKNIKYDYDKIKTLATTYVPDIDSTIDVKKGICYDYSSLFAAMLRSEGIPVKLVKGYRNNSKVYHAWNEVYVESKGEWLVVDTTIDSTSYSNRITGMYKSSSQYNKVNEY